MKNVSKLITYSLSSVILSLQANYRVFLSGLALSSESDLLVVNNNLRLLI
jgi:hypothetical protein